MSVVITVGATDAVGTKMVATTTATISTAVPVCTAVNFTIPTNPKASTVIGAIATTNSPTSSQIVSGNTNNYFAIGLHHTAVSGSPIPPDGIYNLMVDATNAAGTGPAVPVTITVGSAIKVGTASFNLGFPVTLGEVMGTVPHTGGTPALWSFTAGNPSGYFAIDISGKITVTATGVAGLTAATYNLTCQATNGFGASSGMVTVILIPGGSDPWVNLDGRLNAPAGTPQFAGLLSGYGHRPPWNVAGVDYAVGPPAGTSFTDWQTIGTTGITVNTGAQSVTVSGNNITINAVDFSLHGGCQLLISGDNCTIQNSNFKVGSVNPQTPIVTSGNPNNLTITNNIIDGAGLNNQQAGGLIRVGCKGLFLCIYNLIQNAYYQFLQSSAANSGSTSHMKKWNVWANSGLGQPFGAHGDWEQDFSSTAGIPNFTDLEWLFNTYIENVPTATGASQGLSINSAGLNTQGTNAINVANNTMVVPSGSDVNFPIIADTSWCNGPLTVSQNYVDETGSLQNGGNWFSGGVNGTLTGPYNATPVKTGNINMVSGATLT